MNWILLRRYVITSLLLLFDFKQSGVRLVRNGVIPRALFLSTGTLIKVGVSHVKWIYGYPLLFHLSRLHHIQNGYTDPSPNLTI